MLIRPTDERNAFEARLCSALRRGVPLGDIGSLGVVREWLDICRGMAPQALPTAIPEALVRLARDADWRRYIKACGLGGRSARFHLELAVLIACYGRLRDDERDDELAVDLPLPSADGEGAVASGLTALTLASRRIDTVCEELDAQLCEIERELAALLGAPRSLAA